MSGAYSIEVSSPAPQGYPRSEREDEFSVRPFASSFDERRRGLLDFWRETPAPHTFKGAYYELAHLAAGAPVHEGVLKASLDYIDQRLDCADFVLHAILRLLLQFGDAFEDGRLSPSLRERMERTVLGFKYWPDEPGVDSMCTWTENHQILFASAATLAGQVFPDRTFTNSGWTGREQVDRHRPRILRWLDLRFRTGFSEWLSHVYYDEDLTALVNLVDFCHDEEIRQRTAMVIDLLLLDTALNSFKGVFGSTHGRSYGDAKRWPRQEAMTDTMKLLFGTGSFSGEDNMSAVCLALSDRYRMPRVLYEIANDTERAERVNRQRMGIRIAEAERWGLELDDLEDGMVLLSLEAYAHPRTIELVMEMFDAYGWWENAFFEPFAEQRRLLNVLRKVGLLPALAHLFEWDMTRNTREEVNLVTYHTPDYMLSSAQDYRKGYGGDQQHIWQATLGPRAVCFTTHPAREEGPSPNYWTGSGTLPRVAQVENVVFAIYNVRRRPGLYVSSQLPMTHAWLPRDEFDELVERDGWTFARYGDDYLALRSQQPVHWRDEPGENEGRELIAPGRQNVWVCEMGRRATDRGFEQFVDRVCRASVRFGRLHVSYTSPSQGELTFGWNEPLRRGGEAIRLKDCPRYENPYVEAPFPARQIEVTAGRHHITLDWDTGRREDD